MLNNLIDCYVTSVIRHSPTAFQVKSQMVLHQTILSSPEKDWLAVGEWRNEEVRRKSIKTFNIRVYRSNTINSTLLSIKYAD